MPAVSEVGVSDRRLRSWREMLPIAQAIYARNPSGCCWHIVLDDANLDADDVAFCVKTAADEKCVSCMALSPLMLRSTRTQRGKLRMHL